MTRPLDILRAEVAGEGAWIVGGAVRDKLMGRATDDHDVVLRADPRRCARVVARATGAASFPLSESFGAWRVVGPGDSWHLDLVPLRGKQLEDDLRARDFTINAMAEPLAGGEIIDPFGGRGDLERRRLRMVTERSLAEDPLRTLRAVRFATELGFAIDPATRAEIGAQAPQLDRVAAERIFAELKRIVVAPAAVTGVAMLDEYGLAAAVLPELTNLRGVEQSQYHHLDVYGHTLEVLEFVARLESEPHALGLGEHASPVAELLAEPLADGLTRGGAMRFAALLHDCAKPQTRAVRDDGRVTFIAHDKLGARSCASVLRRLHASARLVEYVSALTLHHLRLGYMVHAGPLTRREAWRYMRATAPYAAEATIFTVADRLATRGRNHEQAIEAHMKLVREALGHIFTARAAGRQSPVIRGDDLMRELGVPAGPELGALLERLEEDRYAGEIVTREEAVVRARSLLGRS